MEETGKAERKTLPTPPAPSRASAAADSVGRPGEAATAATAADTGTNPIEWLLKARVHVTAEQKERIWLEAACWVARMTSEATFDVTFALAEGGDLWLETRGVSPGEHRRFDSNAPASFRTALGSASTACMTFEEMLESAVRAGKEFPFPDAFPNAAAAANSFQQRMTEFYSNASGGQNVPATEAAPCSIDPLVMGLGRISKSALESLRSADGDGDGDGEPKSAREELWQRANKLKELVGEDSVSDNEEIADTFESELSDIQESFAERIPCLQPKAVVDTLVTAALSDSQDEEVRIPVEERGSAPADRRKALREYYSNLSKRYVMFGGVSGNGSLQLPHASTRHAEAVDSSFKLDVLFCCASVRQDARRVGGAELCVRSVLAASRRGTDQVAA
jgi:hypothetical protein